MSPCMSDPDEKPVLILVAAGIRSDMGSEPGKGWVWANALAKFYRLEVLTLPGNARHFEERGLPGGWRVHAVGEDFAPGPPWQYYPTYQRWCSQALDLCRRLIETRPIVGLHHITLGSFRVLPRYDLLGIPYTLGPLGGGESIPWALLGQLRLPWREMAVEAVRSPVNHAFALLPNLRAVLRNARITLATTRESLDAVAAIGANRTAIVFPDAFQDNGEDDATVLHRREQQAAALPGRLRCLCAGRALWWKGMHLGVEGVHRMRQRGIDAVLDVYAQGKALAALQAQVGRLGLTDHVTFHGMVSRQQLMQAYADSHLYLYPTMHDSSSLALVEAYSTGLPSMTLGLSGAATVVTAETGLNDRVTNVDDWLEQGYRLAAGWMKDPPLWLRACRAAKNRAHHFEPSYLEQCVREYLEPVFASPPRPPAGS